MGMKNWNGPGMPKEMKRAKNTQKNEISQESPKAIKWDKDAQNSMSTSPMIVLGYWNWTKGKHTADPKEAQQAQVK